MRKVFVALFCLFLIFQVSLRFIDVAKASMIIFIRPDGNIEPSTAPLLKSGFFYIFTGNICAQLVIQKSNIVIDGKGFRLEGDRTLKSIGLYLFNVSNVVVKRLHITDFFCALKLSNSKNCNITENTISNSDFGVWVEHSIGNFISKNIFEGLWCGVNVQNHSQSIQIVENNFIFNEYGVVIDWSKENILVRNNLIDTQDSINLAWSVDNHINENLIVGESKNSRHGIRLHSSSNNIITRNIIENMFYAIRLLYDTKGNIITHNNVTRNFYGIITWYASNNSVYRNRFVENGEQVKCYASTNIWDNGYPNGGNYWSNYVGADEKSGENQDQPGSDGIGDEPYFIDDKNVDRYPLVEIFKKPFFLHILIFFYIFITCSIILIFIVLLLMVYRKRKRNSKPLNLTNLPICQL